MPADRDDYLWDRSGAPDPEVEPLELLLAPLRHDAPLRLDAPLGAPRLARPRPRRRIAIGAALAAAAIVAVVVLAIAWRRRAEPGPVACTGASGFAFQAHGGDVACAGAAMPSGVLPVGATLDTGAHEARLEIARIGNARLGPQTRIRLDRTDQQHHQLHLERGHLHAFVVAPPRMFAVTTPAAKVVDLGCEYTMDIAADGSGWLRVLTGLVELETPTGAVVVAPAGTHAAIAPGRHPGLPITDGASDAIEAAAAAQLEGRPGAVDALLAAAGPEDAITLVNLAVIDPPHRERALRRLAELAPPPPGLLDDALRDPSALAHWRDLVIRGGP
ncbi:MAG: FecR domain-containing protein [Kofleriaceae bacterium]